MGFEKKLSRSFILNLLHREGFLLSDIKQHSYFPRYPNVFLVQRKTCQVNRITRFPKTRMFAQSLPNTHKIALFKR